MRIRNPLLTALVLALAACGGAASQRPSTPLATAGSCAGLDGADQQIAELYAGKVQNVEPIHRTRFVSRAIQPRYVAGARFTVPAERGITAPYLERALTCHAVTSNGAAHPNDPLRVDGIADVDVVARGPGFRVSVIGHDRAAGEAIYERARALESGATQVEVQQVSAATPSRTAL